MGGFATHAVHLAQQAAWSATGPCQMSCLEFLHTPKENTSLVEFSICLFRACLGKNDHLNLWYKRRKTRFLTSLRQDRKFGRAATRPAAAAAAAAARVGGSGSERGQVELLPLLRRETAPAAIITDAVAVAHVTGAGAAAGCVLPVVVGVMKVDQGLVVPPAFWRVVGRRHAGIPLPNRSGGPAGRLHVHSHACHIPGDGGES